MVPYSSVLAAIAEVLTREGFLGSVEKRGRKNRRMMEINIKYDEKDNMPRIKGLKRISKPSCRIYEKANELKVVKNNTGIAVISTSKGMRSNREAHREKIGGEIMLEIW